MVSLFLVNYYFSCSFIQISHFGSRRGRIESLMATLPSKGTPLKPKPRYEDILGLESQGPVGVDPLNIAVGTHEGPNYVNYKMPFYYNSSMDSNPSSDETHHRRRRDSDPSSMVVTLNEQQERQRRFAPPGLNKSSIKFPGFCGQYLYW